MIDLTETSCFKLKYILSVLGTYWFAVWKLCKFKKLRRDFYGRKCYFSLDPSVLPSYNSIGLTINPFTPGPSRSIP